MQKKCASLFVWQFEKVLLSLLSEAHTKYYKGTLCYLFVTHACNECGLFIVYQLVSGFCISYRQVTCTHNKHRTVHAHERELSFCLSSCVENWRYSVVENKSIKAQYLKSIERKRLIEIMR